MGRAVVCDRCGTFAKVDDATKWRSEPYPSVADPAGYLPAKALCDKCAEEFDRWMVTVTRDDSA